MPESNSIRVSVHERTSFDTAGTRDLKILPVTGQTLRNRLGYQQSQIIRTDANVQDLIRLSRESVGGIPTELIFPTVSEGAWMLYRGALRSTETAATTQVTGVSVTASSGVCAAAGVETGIEVGDIVRILTSADAKYDSIGFFKVTAVGTNQITVAGLLTDGVNAKVLRGARMKNSTSKRYFDIEVARTDATLFEIFEKCAVNGFALNLADGSIPTVTFDIVGATSSRGTSTYDGGAGPDAYTATPVMDALDVPVINFGNAASTSKSLGFAIANNIRANTQIGALGAQSLSWGDFACRTSWEGYFAAWTEMTAYTGNTASDIWFVIEDSADRAVSFSFPQHKWNDLTTDTRGLNQTDYMQGSGQAYLNSTQSCTVRMQRWV